MPTFSRRDACGDDTSVEGTRRIRAGCTVWVVIEETNVKAQIVQDLAETHEVLSFDSRAPELEQAIKRRQPDLLIVDNAAAMGPLPSILQSSRQELGEAFPPVLLTYAGAGGAPEASVIADDFLSLPYLQRELLARVRNLLSLNSLRKRDARIVAAPDHQLILEGATEPMGAVDAEWQITYLNAAAERVMQVSRQELLGRVFWDVLPDVKGTTREQEYRRAMRERVAVTVRHAAAKHGGAWFEVDAVPLPDGGLGFYFRNFDQMHQAQVTAQNSDRRLRLFLEHATDYAQIVTDAEGRVTEWLGAAEVITGWSAEERLGKPVSDIFTPEDQMAGRPETELKLAAELGRAEDTRWHQKKDGTVFFADGITTVLRDEDGAIQGFGKVFRDVTTHRLAEEALRQSREQFQLLLNSVADGICGMATDNTCTFTNPAAARMLGYDPQELIGQHFHKLIHHHRADGSEYPLEECKINLALQSGTIQHVDDEVFWCKDGHPVPVRYSVNTIVSDGNVAGAVIAFTDITEAKQAEAALRDSERRLRFVMDAMPQKVFTAKASGEVEYFNPRWPAFTGLPVEQMLGWDWTQLLHPEDHEATIKTWRYCLSSGKSYQMEHRFRSAVGEYFWHLTRALPMRNESGQVVLWVGASTDIDRVKSAEAELARQLAAEQRNAHLLAQIAVASRTMHTVLSVESIARVLVEQARSILQVHQAMVVLVEDEDWGQAVSAVSLSNKYGNYQGSDLQLDGDGLYAEVCRTGKPLRLTEQQLELHPAADANEQAPEHPPLRGVLAVPLIGHGRQSLGLVQVSDRYEGDFSEDDEAVLTQLGVIAAVGIENARLYDSLREQDRRKDEFLATLAHELRNPLAPLRTGLDLLKIPGGTRTVEIRNMMERQLAHMIRLVDDLMDVSRVSRGKVELKQERIAVAAIVDVAVETSSPVIESARHRLTVDIPNEPLYINGDLTRLAQVLNNLLNNAAKYTPDGGDIKLSVEQADGQAILRVSDTGVGLSKEMLTKVFDLFAQVDPYVTRAQGGLGIGLSLVQKLVEMHGGSVTAKSPGLGKGSTFTIRLPLAGQEESEVNAVTSHSSAGAPAGRRILVVDDNIDAAETLATLLRLGGHEVDTAHSGADALQSTLHSSPEAIFLDIGLPDMSGYDVARALRGEMTRKETVLIALTGWGSEEDRKRSREAGFDVHLVKPVDFNAVLAVLKRYFPAEPTAEGVTGNDQGPV